MPWKALQKLYSRTSTNLFRWFFPHSTWNNYIAALMSVIIAIFGELFVFDISRFEKMIAPYFSFKRYATKSSTTAIWKIYIAKRKSLLNIFFMVRCGINMQFCHFDYEKNHQNKSTRVWLYNFSKASDGAYVTKKIKDFIVYESRNICKTTEFFKHFFTVGNSVIIQLPHFQHRKIQQNKLLEVSLDNFCRAFHSASFKRKIQILSFSHVNIYEKQKSVAKLLYHPVFCFSFSLPSLSMFCYLCFSLVRGPSDLLN